MTRTYCAMQLFKLGPLTAQEFAEITGWGRKKSFETLHLLAEAGRLVYVGSSQRGYYTLAEAA